MAVVMCTREDPHAPHIVDPRKSTAYRCTGAVQTAAPVRNFGTDDPPAVELLAGVGVKVEGPETGGDDMTPGSYTGRYKIKTRPSVTGKRRVWLVQDPQGEYVTGGMVFSLASALAVVARDIRERRDAHSGLCHDLSALIRQ